MRSELLGFGAAGAGQIGLRSGTDDAHVAIPEHIVGTPCDASGCAVVDVATGERHTVFLASDGKLWSVGGNEVGQLGRGNRSEGSFTIYPVQVCTSAKFIKVAAGRAHTCAVTEDGRLFAWGDNGSGQCGLPSSLQVVEAPKRVFAVNEVIQVACGPDHTIILLESGRVFVFGVQYDGAAFHDPREVTELIGMPIVSVAAGGRHWAAVSVSGTVLVWGKNDYGQLGTGDVQFRPRPVVLSALSDMKVVACSLGDTHSLFLTQDGRVFACGSDSFGQIGMGKRENVNNTPRVILDLMGSHVTRIATGRIHSLVTVGGRLFSFGLNSSGQLGQGNTRNQITPRIVDGLDSIRSLFAGYEQSFVLRAAGSDQITSGPSVELKRPRVLWWTNERDLLQDKMELLGSIESAFTSLSSLNGSFLHKDDRRFACSSSNHGVELDDAMDFFNALAQSPDAKQYGDLMLESLEMSLFADEIKSRKYLHPECLRVFLLVPWLDAFVSPTPKIVQRLHVPLCLLLSDIKADQMECLSQWWLDVPLRHFRRLVVGLVAAVQCSVDENKNDTKTWTILLGMLSLLHALNEAGERVSLDTFYIYNIGNDRIKQDFFEYSYVKVPNKEDNFYWMRYPFVFNQFAKTEILHVDSKVQQQGAAMSTNQVWNIFGANVLIGDPFFSITIRRDHILEDTLTHVLAEHPEKLRKPMKVTFEGEEAEDRGGVRKEFFIMLFEKLLQPDYGMFTENEESRLIWFSGVEGDADSFRLVGMLCGLAIYNDVLVPIPFPLALYKLILKKDLSLEDLAELSPTEGKGLQSLLDYEGDDVEEVFMLNFTISHSYFGTPVTVPLKEGGEDKPVTSANKAEYVKLYVQARLEEGMNKEISKQIESFCDGFGAIVHSAVIKLFQPRELMEMVVGNENYDWDKFKQRMQYKGVYSPVHPTIIAFWAAFFELSVDERKAFLQFLSGSTRLPVRGFDGIDAAIQPCASHLLPVAHTCFNLLDLPDCPDKTELLKRLRISIQQLTGFSLV